MLRKTLFVDSFDDGRAAVASADMKSKGLYFALYFKTDHPSVLNVETERSDADFLSTSSHFPLGDTECSNLQVEALLAPKLCSESCHSSYLNCDFDGSLSQYTAARATGYAVLQTYGHCDYSSIKDIAYVTPQSDFGWLTEVRTPNSGYTYVDQSIVRYEFVPFGKHHALITTKYSVITYLPKYPQLSYASCRVTVQYAQFTKTGTTVSSAGPQTVMSASGSTPAFHALQALAVGRTSDPTGWGSNVLKGIVAQDLSTPVSDYTHSATYDSRAYLPFYQALAKARLSYTGIICSVDSTVQEIPYATWADLADSAIDDCHYTDTNSISYLRDFRMVFGEVKDAYKLIKNPLNLKSWSNLWLGLRFGTRLTAVDTKSLIDGARRACQLEKSTWKKKFQYVRSRSTMVLHPSLPGATATRTLNYKVYYRPNNDVLSRAAKLATDVGLFPTTSNLWDLIPLTFVVDWFVDVGDVLDSIDRRAYEQYLTILGCTYSFKDEYNIPVCLSDLGFEDTTCVVRYYVRQHRPSIHQSYLRLTAGHLSHVNVIDGLTLLVQRLAK